MKNNLLSFLGIARKSGNTIFGMDIVKNELNKGNVKLVINTEDISENSLQEIKNASEKNNVKILTMGYKKDDIYNALGKYSAIIGILNENFAKRISEIIDDQTIPNIDKMLQTNREECNL